ncbi:hypothetical protein WID27_04490 [Streptomyces sp. F41]|uniref:hypothetical protein n=1 Tax=Streptomyces sp. F41 TaxID=1795888 RepID=UPI0030D43D87
MSELHAGQVYAVDMDPRWVKRLIRAGRLAEVDDYTTHLLEQITDVLRQGRVHYLNTTPALRPPTDHWPTDGVANIRPLRITDSSPEGLY